MAPKGEGVSEKKLTTPSFVSMWPDNFELLSMVKKVSKRKHILEFPLFKRTENQTKIEAWTRKTLDEKKSYATQTHTLKHTHAHRILCIHGHTQVRMYICMVGSWK